MYSSTTKPHRSSTRLACVGCRSRKIRCNRARPVCDGCFARRQTYIYPETRRRKPDHSTARSKPTRNSDGVLSNLLDRLLQVEEQCARLLPASPNDRPATDSNIFAVTDTDGNPSAPPPAFSESPETDLVTSALEADTDAVNDVEEPLLCTSNCPFTPENAESRLKQALEQVLHLKRQNINKEAIDTCDSIPIDLYKACLDSSASR